jgi:hypothetical protein
LEADRGLAQREIPTLASSSVMNIVGIKPPMAAILA